MCSFVFYYTMSGLDARAMAVQRLIALLRWKYNQYTVCDGPTCKGKEKFSFVGGGWGGSEGQKKIYDGLPLPTIVQKKWRGALIWGLCLFSRGIRYYSFLKLTLPKYSSCFWLLKAGISMGPFLLRSIMILKINLFTSKCIKWSAAY